MKLTGAAIPVSRGMKVLQAAPAAYPYRSATNVFTSIPKEDIKMSKFVTIAAVSCLILGICFFGLPSRALPSADAQEGGELKVDAAQLSQDYKDNEVAANEKYKGKTLVVTGKVYRITTKDVELKGVSFYRIQCRIGADDTDKVKKYKAGQELTIKGVCEGKASLGVALTKCKFE